MPIILCRLCQGTAEVNELMNAPLIPPPLPPEARSPGPKVAFLSIVAVAGPICVLILWFCHAVFNASKPEGTPGSGWTLMIVAGAVVSVVSVIAALYVIVAKYNREGTNYHMRGIAGLVLLGLALGAHLQQKEVRKQMDKRDRIQQTAKTKEAVDRINADARKEFQENGPSASSQKHLERLQEEYQKASANLKGNDKLSFEAGAAYTARLQEEAKKYETQLERLQAAEVLAPASNPTREKLAQNRQLVHDFMAANLVLSNFVHHSARHFEEELKARKVPEKLIEQNMIGFNSTSSRQRPLMLKIRATDARIGTATLGLLDIMDTHFGKWTTELGSGKLVLPDDEAVEKYQRIYLELTIAAEEQGELQKKMFNLNQK